jgi:hypothetical protein
MIDKEKCIYFFIKHDLTISGKKNKKLVIIHASIEVKWLSGALGLERRFLLNIPF